MGDRVGTQSAALFRAWGGGKWRRREVKEERSEGGGKWRRREESCPSRHSVIVACMVPCWGGWKDEKSKVKTSSAGDK
jgi:hypothetical protein